MAFDDEGGFGDLDYQANFEQFAARFVRGKNIENDRYFINNAKEMHIFAVNNALMKLVGDLILMAASIKLIEKANYFFSFGVGRRLRMLMSSFQNFQSIIPPDRVVPLTMDQSDAVCRDLNSIYINIIGALDNYAWVMVHQFGNERTKRASPTSIGLFKSALAEDSNLKPTIDALSSFSGWERDIKNLRDPAAHRMPLYVPPAAYAPEDVAEVNSFESLMVDALRAKDFQRLSDLRSAGERVGRFLSVFLHDPDIPPVDIYPTVPQDIGKMVKIGRVVQTFVREAASAR
jgi:hypothetical protein